MRKPHRHLLWIWEICALLAAALLGGICALLFVLPLPRWIGWTAVGISVAFLLIMSLFYLPIAYRRREFGIVGDNLVTRGGVIYLFHKTMPLQSVKYVMSIRGPLEQLFHLTILVVFSAGSLLLVSGLTEEEGEAMQLTLLAGQRRNGDG